LLGRQRGQVIGHRGIAGRGQQILQSPPRAPGPAGTGAR
jgi:hypothetical protein